MLRGLVRQAREERFRRARGRSPARRRRRRRARGRTSRRRAPDKLRFLRRGGRLRCALLRRRGRASPRGDGRGAPTPHDAVLARHRAPRRLRGAPPRGRRFRGAPPRPRGPPPPRRLVGVERRLREPAGRQRRVGVRIEGPGVCRIGHGLERAVARHGVRRSKQHDAARREARRNAIGSAEGAGRVAVEKRCITAQHQIKDIRFVVGCVAGRVFYTEREGRPAWKSHLRRRRCRQGRRIDFHTEGDASVESRKQ